VLSETESDRVAFATKNQSENNNNFNLEVVNGLQTIGITESETAVAAVSAFSMSTSVMYLYEWQNIYWKLL